MASDLDNLTEKIENLSIDPVYNTNWCHMPAEIKLECIGKMEFKERLSLRCTAKAERSLVDSQKIVFTRGRFQGYDEVLVLMLYRDNKYNCLKRLDNSKKISGFIKFIKKIGVFDHLEIVVFDSFTHNKQFITDDGLFTAKEIKFELCHSDNGIAVLGKVENGVESIKIDIAIAESDELAKILAIPQVKNVPYWHIRYYGKTDSLYEVAKMWIDKNPKIGHTFQVAVYTEGSFEEFLKHFTDSTLPRRVKKESEFVPTTRHILLERGLDEVITIDYYDQYFRLMVISAEMKESEYDENCEEWILKVDPYVYDRYHAAIRFEQYR